MSTSGQITWTLATPRVGWKPICMLFSCIPSLFTDVTLLLMNAQTGRTSRLEGKL